MHLTINNSHKIIHALVTKGSPLTDLLVGWKTLVKWGIFKLTVNTIGPAAIYPSPSTALTVNAIGATSTYSSTLPQANRAFLAKHKTPIKRTFPMPRSADPQYESKINETCPRTLKLLKDNYKLAFSA